MAGGNKMRKNKYEHTKTAKVIKYMSTNWGLHNEYTDYDEFMKL